jgi:hypothetical protein
MNGVPCHADDVLVVTAQEKDVPHHAEIEDASGVITGACGEQVALAGLKLSF